MYDASIGLDLGESISIHDCHKGLCVHIWLEQDGTLSISVNRGKDRDNVQLKYVDGELTSVTSPEGEPIRMD